MSNEINTSMQAPRVELPSTPAAAALNKVRQEATQQIPKEVTAERAPDPKELKKQMEEAAEHLNRQMQRDKRDLSFSVDDVANKIVVTVKNTQSGEVIRQIPNEAALKVAQNLADVKGLLEDKKI